MEIIKCKNCGADIDKNVASCPYCGELNYAGAEKEYMEHLGDIRTSLENLAGESNAEVIDEVANVGRVIKRSFIIMAVIIFILGGLYITGIVLSNANDAIYESAYGKSSYKDKVLWLSNYEPMLNEMYDNGEYEEIIAFKEEHSNEREYSYWKHSEFMELYGCYSEYNSLKDNSNINNSILGKMLYDVIMVQTYKDGNYTNLSKGDVAVLDELGAEMDNFYKDYLGIEGKEIDQLIKSICYENEHYYVNTSTCNSYVENLLD